jgi:rhamnosyltransferase
MPTPISPPRVTVLLATYNGRRWLPEQLASILAQREVAVRVIALDDGSTDGTREWLAEQDDPRLTVLPPSYPTGSAAGNFYRLIERAPIDDADYVAFADQDDLWMPDKLSRHVALARAGDHDGISSNVTSFTESGARTLIRKSFPQREFDYLLESPGPGSTFLMTPRLVALARDVLATEPRAHEVDYHDWLVYALARARGWSWHIDPESTVDYRQHSDNAMGANVGGASAVSRLGLIRKRWHRGQAVLLAQLARTVAAPSTLPGLERMLALMTAHGPGARLALARRAGSLRRRPRDRRIIGFLIATGGW